MVPTALVVRQLSAQASCEPQTFTGPLTVGRSPDCAVQIIHPLVSRTHLLLTPTPAGWQVTCQGRNGMLVDGVVTREALINQGTRIQLGDASGPALGLTPVATAPPQGPGPAGQQAPSATPGPQPYAPPAPAPMAASSPQMGGAMQPPGPSGPTTPPPVPQQAPIPRPAPVAASGAALPTQQVRAVASAPSGPMAGMPQPAPAGAMSSAASAATVIAPTPPPSPASGEAASSPRKVLQSFRITSSGTIGRAPDNALVLDDPLVSKHHARVDLTPQGIVVTDLGSTNGIYVAGQRVPTVQVTQPVVVGMGSTFVSISPDGLCEVQVSGGVSGELVGKDLTFRVNSGQLTLLDGISFSLPGNELLAVVGPSGAGKSTLLKALTGEQKAQEGQVLFDGLDVYEHYPVMRNKIGVVPQNDVVHAALTVRQTLEYAAELRFAKDVTKAERKQRIAEVLEDLDLSAHVDKRVKKLSGGQRKRVSTAIELLTRPSLLFLDEPTSGLDPQLDRDVMDLLASLAHGTRPGDTGRTVVVVTHNENHIDRADKVLILAAGGKPVYYGSPREVLPYFRARLGEIAAHGQLLLNAPKGTLPDPPAVDGYADVYALIRNHTAELRAHLEATVPSTRRGGARPAQSTPAPEQRRTAKQSAVRQISTLVRRHLRIIAADPSYLAFMLILPVIMGLLTKAIEGSDGLSIPDYPDPTPDNPVIIYSTQAIELLVILITGAAFSGMAATIRELVGERDVFLREKAVGLRSGSYMMAKAIVLALIVTVQTAVMVGIALALNKAPSDAVLMGSPGLELAFCCWAVAFVSGLLGLAVSAFVSSSEQVMPVLVVSIMAQLVLSGGIIPIDGRAVFEQLSWFMPARWGYAMAAATTEMNTIIPTREDGLWDHEVGQWLMNYGILSAIGLVCLCLCLIGLVRRGRR
ncbi:MAG: ATP-binding cassette domain-containing protein [Actinomyces bowdenii]|nr:ATP-binding cassette domain-containing protein [Actinomyces bowdenii]